MKKLLAMLVGILVIGIAFADTADMTVSVGSAAPVVDSVVVADAAPTAGTTTQISVTTVITDTNGVDDIDTVTAAFTVGAPTNGNPVTTMTRAICADVDDDTITCTATYDMLFYDDDMTYTIEVTATDFAAQPDSLSDTFAYSELLSLEIDATTIAFGSVEVGILETVPGDENMATLDATTIKNQGNALIDASISATDFSGSTDSFSAGEADSQFGVLGYIALSNGGRTETGLDLNYGASLLENVDFQLTVPVGALPETYTSTVTITAEINA